MYEAIKVLDHYTDILTGGVQKQLEKMKLKELTLTNFHPLLLAQMLINV